MKKILLFITLLMLTFTQTIFAAESNKENEEDKLQTEKITLTEMNQRLQNIQGDILYLKTGEDEVFVYQDTAIIAHYANKLSWQHRKVKCCVFIQITKKPLSKCQKCCVITKRATPVSAAIR